MPHNAPDEPAFPAEEVHGDGVQQVKRHQGLTVRQYIAIAAMQGILASQTSNEFTYAEIARNAYRQADAMLAEQVQS